MRKSLKICIIIKHVIEAEDTMKHSAECPSNYFSNTFTLNQAEQTRKEYILSKLC